MCFLKLMPHLPGFVGRGEREGWCPLLRQDSRGEQLWKGKSFHLAGLWLLRAYVRSGFKALKWCWAERGLGFTSVTLGRSLMIPMLQSSQL